MWFLNHYVLHLAHGDESILFPLLREDILSSQLSSAVRFLAGWRCEKKGQTHEYKSDILTSYSIEPQLLIVKCSTHLHGGQRRKW